MWRMALRPTPSPRDFEQDSRKRQRFKLVEDPQLVFGGPGNLATLAIHHLKTTILEDGGGVEVPNSRPGSADRGPKKIIGARSI
jgi:hypothetical protein